jgi:hypothetical protein
MAFRNSILAGEELVRSGIRSPNFVAGVAGWRIAQDGTAEFNDVVVRGDVIVGPGPPTGSQIRVITDGTRGVIEFESPLGEQFDMEAEDLGGVLPTFQVRRSGALAPALRLQYDPISGDDFANLTADRVELFGSGTLLQLGKSGGADVAKLGTGAAQDQLARWNAYAVDIPVLTVGATGTKQGLFRRLGRTCHVQNLFALAAGAGIAAGNWNMTLPAQASTLADQFLAAWCFDASTALSFFAVAHIGAGAVAATIHTVGGPAAAAVPFAWAPPDRLSIAGTYETEAAI